MRKGKFVTVLFTMMLALSIPCFFYLGTMVGEEDPITFYVHSDGNAEKIKCWEDEEGKCYVFLPSYAEMGNVTIGISGNTDLYIDDVLLQTGTVCDPFMLNTEYNLSGVFRGEPIDQKIIFVRSANVPAMYIDTQSGSMDHIHEKKGNEEPGLMRIYEKNGEQCYSGELESMKGRGNTTWEMAKKPYSIQLVRQSDLLNMGAAQDWILLANAKDDTHLLNKLAYDLARDVGMQYTPECEWVDLYLNGKYVGLYLLCERVEVHPERVDISNDGSFLVSKEVQGRLENQGYPHIVTTNKMPLRIHYSSISENDLSHIWQLAVDAVLTGEDWISKIDIDSWATRMLVDEVFGNGDGGVASQFFYGNISEGKIYAGPVWDMDLCLAQTGWPGGYTNAILSYRQQLNWMEESLYSKLYQYPVFHDRMINLYETVFLPVISELLEEKFMCSAEWISQAASNNCIRWNSEEFPNEVQENYDFLKERVEFLNSYWMEEENYCMIHIEPGYSGVWGCFAVKSGDRIPSVYGDTLDGWYVLDTEVAIDITQSAYEDGWSVLNTGKLFDITQPVYEDATIFHRDNVNILFKSIEEYNMENVRVDSVENLSLQRVVPVLAFVALLLSLVGFDVLIRKMK